MNTYLYQHILSSLFTGSDVEALTMVKDEDFII